MRYQQARDGDWIEPRRSGYRVRCCDCDLVHVIDLRLVRRGSSTRVQYRARRDARATAAARRRRRAREA